MICPAICTKAAVLCALNAFELPPRGTVIEVPAAKAAEYSVRRQVQIAACALRFGIVLKKGS